jgi:Ser/Thr protein kinase RdoA (MazF antagonist)
MARIGTVIREVYHRPGAAALPAHLEDHYGIRVTGTARLETGVFRLEQDGGPPWVARMFLTSRPVARTEEDAGILAFLERRAFPAERCAHAKPVTVLDGRAILVTGYLAGRRPRSDRATWQALGGLLGRLHTLAPEPGPAQRPGGALHHLPQFEGAPSQDLAAAAALLADLDGRVPDRYRPLYERIAGLLPEADDGRGLPEAFVHPDPVTGNVVVTPGGPAFVDWAGAGCGPRLASLAGLLHTAGPGHAGDVLAGYRRHITLTAEELDRAGGVLWIRPLWLAAWQCWLACVSPRVSQVFVPYRGPIEALAGQVRAYSRGPA